MQCIDIEVEVLIAEMGVRPLVPDGMVYAYAALMPRNHDSNNIYSLSKDS